MKPTRECFVSWCYADAIDGDEVCQGHHELERDAILDAWHEHPHGTPHPYPKNAENRETVA